MSASYAPAATVPGGLTAELARLRDQAELTWAEEWQILRPLVAPGLPLLDLGCGPGEVARRIAELAPDLDVIGLDADPQLLQLAATSTAAAVVGDAGRLPLGSHSMGTVLARYLLQHITDLRGVLAEVRRVLAPGGWFVAIDVDEAIWGVCEPRAAGLEPIYAAAARVQVGNGGNRLVVRSMTRLLQAAGFTDVALKPFAVDTGTRTNIAMGPHLAPDRLIPAVAAGAITTAQYGQVFAAHQRFLHDPDAYAMLLGFAVVGRNPRHSKETSCPLD